MLQKFHMSWRGQKTPLEVMATDKVDAMFRIPGSYPEIVPWTGLVIWTDEEWKHAQESLKRFYKK